MDMPMTRNTPTSAEDQSELNSSVGVIDESDALQCGADDGDPEALPHEHQERVQFVEALDGLGDLLDARAPRESNPQERGDGLHRLLVGRIPEHPRRQEHFLSGGVRLSECLMCAFDAFGTNRPAAARDEVIELPELPAA